MPLNVSSARVADGISFSGEDELAAYRRMLLIRRFEEKAGQLYALEAFHGPCPLSIGQEGSIVGVLMAAEAGDPIITAQRTHGHMLARGVDPRLIMAELLGREAGLSKGRGGSVNMYSPEHGFYGGHSMPGLCASLGTGLAFAARYNSTGAVCLCFFGEGAASRGRVLESYKIAADWRLPIVFVIDNSVAAPGSVIVLGELPSALASSGARVAIPGEQVDGIDVRRARAAASRAIARARRGEGPTILEMLTFSYRGHEGLPAQPGRAEKRRDETDPVAKSRARILADGFATDADIKAIEKDVRDAVNAAAVFAKGAGHPTLDGLQSGVYA